MTCYNTLVNGLERNMLKQGADMISQVMIKYKPRRNKRKKGLVKTCKHMYNDVHDTCGAVFIAYFCHIQFIKAKVLYNFEMHFSSI